MNPIPSLVNSRFWRKWRRDDAVLIVVLAGIVGLLAYHLPTNIWEIWAKSLKDPEMAIKALTALAILIGVYAALRRSWSLETSAQAAQTTADAANTNAKAALAAAHHAQQQQINDRFHQAVAMLASDRLRERLGGIYSLERIARETDEDALHQVIFEVLCAFVREVRPLPPDGEPSTPLPEDVKAVIEVIQRRERVPEKERIDLQRTDLSGAIFSGAKLFAARFNGARLNEAQFLGADLSSANFQDADLCDALFLRAKLYVTSFIGAKLHRATFHGAETLQHSNFTGAELQEADFSGLRQEGRLMGPHGEPKLADTEFNTTLLQGTDFCGADLSRSHLTSLLPSQLAKARGNSRTKLPEGWEIPRGWSSWDLNESEKAEG